MSTISVTIDASKLEKWATELSTKGLRNSIRRAVDRSATAVRKIALDIIAQDIGVPKARIKDGVTKVKHTTQTSLPNTVAEAPATISAPRLAKAGVRRRPVGRGART